MLATILKSKIATQVSIRIMDAFVKMKKYISNELLNTNIINTKLLEHDNRISLLEQTFSKFKENTNEIYYEGQIYDAYSKLVDIMSKAKNEVIIIDAYADKSVLDIVCNIKCKVILICKTKTLLNHADIAKYNQQYNNFTIIYRDDFHDRYFLLDRNTLYHPKASINYTGSKTFSINIIEDKILKNSFINNLLNYIS